MKSTLLLILLATTLPGAQTRWVATWPASPAPQLADDAQMRAARLVFDNQTLRQIVHTSIGGSSIRVRLSNVYGKNPAEIGAAHIGIRSSGSDLVFGLDRQLFFGGHDSVVIPPGATVISDPVRYETHPSIDLAVSLYFPNTTTGAGIHYSSMQTNYIGTANQGGAQFFTRTATIASWVFLGGVDVLTGDTAFTIVPFGDSITDGSNSTSDTNQRWPNFLSNRLIDAGMMQTAVIDSGIGGNRILHDALTNVRFGLNALSRFERDVIAQPGVKYVILLEGINDLGHPGSSTAPLSESVTAEDIIAGLRQMAERAHEAGIKVFGATLTPFTGYAGVGYFTAQKEVYRKAVNDWIRTTDAFDAFIDFEKAVRDPANPDRILTAYDSGDHLHPGNAGYKAMADAIDLTLFQ
jgi:lysophospholipase L1-like esterase